MQSMTALIGYNPWISTATCAWIIAQALKMLISTIVTKRWDFRRLVDTGGMPSSHTSFVSSLSTSIGLTEGFTSLAFAIAAAFSLIVIYDATNLRRAAGRHAAMLNNIVPALLHGRILTDEFKPYRLRELLGHTPAEVLVGGVLGVTIAMWMILRLEIHTWY